MNNNNNHLIKGIAFILFSVPLVQIAFFLLIWDPWIPILNSATVFEILFVLTGFIFGVIGVITACKQL